MRGEASALRDADAASLEDLEALLLASLGRVRSRARAVREEERRAHDEERLCAICMDNPKDTVLVPCGHQLCAACRPRLQRCHLCQQPIERHVRLYS